MQAVHRGRAARAVAARLKVERDALGEIAEFSGALVEAERRGVPIHVLKSNAAAQMERALLALYDLPDDPREMALREAANGVEEVLRTAHPVELAPQSAFIRRLQHQLAGEANITSSSRGRDPHRRVRLEPPGRASSTPRRRR
jgi:hypothetical protein